MMDRRVDDGLPAIGVLTIGQIDILAEVAVEHSVVMIGTAIEHVLQGTPVNVGVYLGVKPVHHGRHQIHRRRKSLSTAGVDSGLADDQGDVDELLIVEHVVRISQKNRHFLLE